MMIELLEKIIAMLSSPLTEQEKTDGWFCELKSRWFLLMKEYKEKIQTNKYKEGQEEKINFGYGLGYEGVGKGELARLICEFGRKWNEKYAEKPVLQLKSSDSKGTKRRNEFKMTKNKTQLWQIGLIVFILGGLINSVLIRAGIGGILRELMRLTVLAGLVLFIVGLFKRPKKNKP